MSKCPEPTANILNIARKYVEHAIAQLEKLCHPEGNAMDALTDQLESIATELKELAE